MESYARQVDGSAGVGNSDLTGPADDGSEVEAVIKTVSRPRGQEHVGVNAEAGEVIVSVSVKIAHHIGEPRHDLAEVEGWRCHDHGIE